MNVGKEGFRVERRQEKKKTNEISWEVVEGTEGTEPPVDGGSRRSLVGLVNPSDSGQIGESRADDGARH